MYKSNIKETLRKILKIKVQVHHITELLKCNYPKITTLYQNIYIFGAMTISVCKVVEVLYASNG